jgi:hypothetical protein
MSSSSLSLPASSASSSASSSSSPKCLRTQENLKAECEGQKKKWGLLAYRCLRCTQPAAFHYAEVEVRAMAARAAPSSERKEEEPLESDEEDGAADESADQLDPVFTAHDEVLASQSAAQLAHRAPPHTVPLTGTTRDEAIDKVFEGVGMKDDTSEYDRFSFCINPNQFLCILYYTGSNEIIYIYILYILWYNIYYIILYTPTQYC